MANVKFIYVHVGDCEAKWAGMVGKIVNAYDTYANALAHAATGLVTVYELNRLSGLIKGPTTQTAKTAGIVADNNGVVVFGVDADSYSEVFLMSEAGRFGGPRRIAINSTGTGLTSESSSSSTAVSETSSSSYSSSSSSSSSSTANSSSTSSGTSASSASSSSSSGTSESSITSSSSSTNSSSSTSSSSTNSSSSTSSSSSSPSSMSRSSSSSSSPDRA